MSNEERWIQYTKLIVFAIAFIGFSFWAIRVLALLEIIAQNG